MILRSNQFQSTRINPPIPGPQFEATSSYKTYDPAVYGNGPLQLGFQGYVTDSTTGFVRACEAANIPIVNDLNSGNGVGVKLGTATLDARLRRSSSYDSFYKQAAGRSNLNVLNQAPVTSINTEAISDAHNGTQAKATGVNFVDQSTSLVHKVTARKEVIISLGAFHSPQLLMLSVRTLFSLHGSENDANLSRASDRRKSSKSLPLSLR